MHSSNVRIIIALLVEKARKYIGAAVAADSGQALPSLYDRYVRAWFFLGWPAFLGLIGAFAMMVMKPSLWWLPPPLTRGDRLVA